MNSLWTDARIWPGFKPWWPVFMIRYDQIWTPKYIHTSHRSRWWCIIFDARNCQAQADELLMHNKICMISMLNKEEKKGGGGADSDSVCYNVFSGLLSQWVINTVGRCQHHTMRDTNKNVICTGMRSDMSSTNKWALTFRGAWGGIESSREM